MTDLEHEFMLEILRHPERDDVRLIYADWLEENGREDRAEFIRVQIELANLECKEGDPVGYMGVMDVNSGLMYKDVRAGIFLEREKELLCDGRDYAWFIQRGVIIGPSLWSYRRGFVHCVESSSSCFELDASNFFSNAPIEEVRLIDLEPFWWIVDSFECEWLREEHFDNPEYNSNMGKALIPNYLWPDLAALKIGEPHKWTWANTSRDNILYSIKKDAEIALSRACVRYGRRICGLPEITYPSSKYL